MDGRLLLTNNLTGENPLTEEIGDTSEWVAEKVMTTDSAGKATTSSISKTELECLEGCEQNIVLALSAKQSAISDTTELSAKSLALADLTASTVLLADADKAITSSTVSSTELGYLAGVTSGVQEQLDTINTVSAHLTYDDTVPELVSDVSLRCGGSFNPASTGANIGDQTRFNMVNSKSAIVDGLFPLSSPSNIGGVTKPYQHAYVQNIFSETLTESSVLIADSNKRISSSTVSSSELGCLSGASSNIQQQLDSIGGTTFFSYDAATDSLTGEAAVLDINNVAATPTVIQLTPEEVAYPSPNGLFCETCYMPAINQYIVLTANGSVYKTRDFTTYSLLSGSQTTATGIYDLQLAGDVVIASVSFPNTQYPTNTLNGVMVTDGSTVTYYMQTQLYTNPIKVLAFSPTAYYKYIAVIGSGIYGCTSLGPNSFVYVNTFYIAIDCLKWNPYNNLYVGVKYNRGAIANHLVSCDGNGQNLRYYNGGIQSTTYSDDLSGIEFHDNIAVLSGYNPHASVPMLYLSIDGGLNFTAVDLANMAAPSGSIFYRCLYAYNYWWITVTYAGGSVYLYKLSDFSVVPIKLLMFNGFTATDRFKLDSSNHGMIIHGLTRILTHKWQHYFTDSIISADNLLNKATSLFCHGERCGSNANGSYLVLGCGLLMCWWTTPSGTALSAGTSSTITGLRWSPGVTWIYPHEFAAPPHVQVTAIDYESGLYWASLLSTESTLCIAQLFGSSTGPAKTQFLAIGFPA